MRPFPELRHDLVISEHRQNGQTIFVVKDPAANKFFQFVAFQYYVATLLDGKTSLESIQEAVSERMRKPVTPQALEAFVAKLESSGLLERSASTAGKATAEEEIERPDMSSTERQSVLYYRVPLVKPHRIFDLLHPWVSFCFTPQFVVFSVVWVAVALGGIATDWEAYVEQIARFQMDPSLLLSIYIILLLTLTIHELAHGIACRHFGGTVSDMGFLLMYFQPCVYTDVSDSYLFPRKRARMIVMIAGMYSGIMIVATAALLWRIADPGTWLHQTCFVVMAVTAWNLFFNLNPLLKLDGYYILNDGLNIPNLRRKAFEYLKKSVGVIFGKVVSHTSRLTSRERWIYLSYGTLAFVYSFSLIGIFVWFVKDFMIEYAPEFGLIGLVSGCVAMAVQSSDRASSTPTSQKPVISSGQRISFKSIGWGILLLLIVLCLIFVEIELRISAPFQLRSRDQAFVRAKAEGQLEEIYVDEGDTVHAGQILARLSTRDLDAKLRTVNAQIDQAQAQQALLERGARHEEIEHAEAALQEALTNQEAARISYERASTLARRQVIATDELEAAHTDHALKQAMVDQAKSRLSLLRAGSRQEEIDAMRAEIEGLTATADHLNEQRRLCEIESPINGTIVTRFLKERRDEYVEVGDVICELINHRMMLVEMAVPEREVGDVDIGFPVKFKVQGFPSRSFQGNVTAIAPIASTYEGHSVVRVRSQLINVFDMLKPGMTGSARIYCGSRTAGALMLRRIIRYIRIEFWW